jgi:hypothetical protein
MVDDEDTVAEMREDALGLVSLQPRESAAGDRRSYAVGHYDYCPDEAEAEADHPPANVVGRSRDLGSLPYSYQRRSTSLCSERQCDHPVVERLHLNVGGLCRLWTGGNAPNTARANEPMVDEETEAVLVEACFARDRPDEAPTKRGNDKDTPDRPSAVDDTQARCDVPSMQSARRAGKKNDPPVGLLDCPEGMLIAVSERLRDPSGARELLGGATRVA